VSLPSPEMTEEKLHGIVVIIDHSDRSELHFHKQEFLRQDLIDQVRHDILLEYRRWRETHFPN